MIEDHPHIRPKELIEGCDYSHRTITKALKVLRSRKLIKTVPDLTNMARTHYVPTRKVPVETL